MCSASIIIIIIIIIIISVIGLLLVTLHINKQELNWNELNYYDNVGPVAQSV